MIYHGTTKLCDHGTIKVSGIITNSILFPVMLINLWLQPTNNELKFDLPPVLFKQGQSVCVSRLFIEWKSSTLISALVLKSSLIDKSTINPSQQILFATQPETLKRLFYFDFTPTQKEYYKIQCLNLRSSEYKLSNLSNTELPAIKRIFVQLDIDERIQSIAL